MYHQIWNAALLQASRTLDICKNISVVLEENQKIDQEGLRVFLCNDDWLEPDALPTNVDMENKVRRWRRNGMPFI